jgi:hypothetical protein
MHIIWLLAEALPAISVSFKALLFFFSFFLFFLHISWLLAEALPEISAALAARGLDPATFSLDIIGNITPRTCAPAICHGGVCVCV